jgi:hypothetical protein
VLLQMDLFRLGTLFSKRLILQPLANANKASKNRPRDLQSPYA